MNVKWTSSLLVLLVACASGVPVDGTLTFDKTDLVLGEMNGMTVVSLPSRGMTWEVGAPSLPIAAARLVVPQGMEVVGVRLESFETELIEGSYLVFPVQKPKPVSAQGEPEFTPPDPAYYDMDEYPARIVVAGKQGMMFGYNIATVMVAPVQYVSAERKLLFHAEVSFSLVLEPNEAFRKTGLKRSEAARRRIEEDLADMVLNPEALTACRPGVEPN